ncbi:MAG: hypothetical protein HQK63_00085 [Desulfamplus sp.]|nr:hypothetical protein [Desulfamplus sp.]
MSTVQEVITKIVNKQNELYSVIQNISLQMTTAPEIFQNPGALFQMQIRLQQLKDYLAAVTAIGQIVNDSTQDAIENFLESIAV